MASWGCFFKFPLKREHEIQGGIFSFKRECPPLPPKEKRGGISISPRTPLKRHKGAGLRPLPFGNPSQDQPKLRFLPTVAAL